MKKAIRVYLFGTVQGVFFRDFIKKNADSIGIKGYARNRDDGSVEVWIEGVVDDVAKMLELCKQGPPHSVIKRLDQVDEKFQGFKDFKILSI